MFSDATGVASIITQPDGRPITRPSNFCRLCNEIIRNTEKGLANCFKSDAEIGKPNSSGPVIKPCLSGGLWDAGASIIVGDHHIANWLIGQVKNEVQDSGQMIQYADKIGADRTAFMNALDEVPVMSKEKFEKVAQMLYSFANELSSKAYQNKKLQQSVLERNIIAEQLVQEQNLMYNLMDNLPDHIYFKDMDSRFLRTNKSHALSFGLDDPEQVVGKSDFDFFAHEAALQALGDELAVINTGLPIKKEEKLTRKDFSDAWFDVIKMPLHDKHGKMIGTFGISRDITGRKKIEEELAAERNLLRKLIDNMPDRIYAKDLNGRFIVCNNALIKRMGKESVDDIIGKTDFDFLPHDLAAQYFENEQEILSSGQPLINHEESMGSVDGTIRWNLTSKVPLRDSKGQTIGIVGIGRDITDRKLAEEEITLKNELLQTINAEKDKFFSIIAHDLKGPLSAFLGATQILSDEIHNMSLEEIKEITINMKDSASNLYGLLENLLEWSRLKRGLMDFNPDRIKIKRLITQSIEVLKESARKKNISVRFLLSEDMEIFADLHMLETVVRNLVSNAIKFTPVGGEVIISASKTDNQYIEINVIDSGIGMSPEIKSKLFGISEKISRQGTEGEPSTGLGLLLCKEFIEKHNGRIYVESIEGKGSRFSFTI
jgi:PAS domain S-box-containing protein